MLRLSHTYHVIKILTERGSKGAIVINDLHKYLNKDIHTGMTHKKFFVP